MAKNNNKKGKLKYKLTNKYRLVVLNESTFEERLSLKLSRLNIYIFGGVFSVTLILATILLIAFTPIKEYIPGYSSTKLQKDARRLTIDSDSLKNRLAILENYTNSIKSVLTVSSRLNSSLVSSIDLVSAIVTNTLSNKLSIIVFPNISEKLEIPGNIEDSVPNPYETESSPL